MLREWKRGGLALHFCIEFGDFGKWRQTKKAMFPPLSLLSLYILLIKTFKTRKRQQRRRGRGSPQIHSSQSEKLWEKNWKKMGSAALLDSSVPNGEAPVSAVSDPSVSGTHENKIKFNFKLLIFCSHCINFHAH